MAQLKGMEIRVYGKETCGICKEAKENIKKAIINNKVESLVKLVELDIEKDVDALAEYTVFGTSIVPVIEFKDLDTEVSSKGKGIAPSLDYLKSYFITKGYIN